MHCNLQIDGFLVGKIGVFNLHAAFGASVKLGYIAVSSSVVSLLRRIYHIHFGF